MTRVGIRNRETKETKVSVDIDLDGLGLSTVKTPMPFFDHLLGAFAKHSLFDLIVEVEGDIELGDHHIVEDVAICLGEAFRAAVALKLGIARMGDNITLMDDAVVTCAVDLSGRSYVSLGIPAMVPRFLVQPPYPVSSVIGGLSLENVPHFYKSFGDAAQMNLYLKVGGVNNHHMVEASFKALGRALHEATRITRKDVPSTKGEVEKK